jgi:hypothetical protein
LDLFRTDRRRRQRMNFGCHAEECEVRLLLSATAMGGTMTAHSAPAPRPSKIVRDPSSGGPNGTSFLANDATTPPNWAQQQNATVTPPLDSQVNSTSPALNEASLPVSGGFNVGVGVSLNGPALTDVFGSLTFGNIAFNDQSLTQSQANYSAATFAFQSPAGSLANGPTGNGENAANGSLNGLTEPLPPLDLRVAPAPNLDISPLPSLDLAFVPTADSSSPLGW